MSQSSHWRPEDLDDLRHRRIVLRQSYDEIGAALNRSQCACESKFLKNSTAAERAEAAGRPVQHQGNGALAVTLALAKQHEDGARFQLGYNRSWTKDRISEIRHRRLVLQQHWSVIGAAFGVSSETAAYQFAKHSTEEERAISAGKTSDDSNRLGGSVAVGTRRNNVTGWALPPGSPETWGLLTRGTILEGSPYPHPVPDAR